MEINWVSDELLILRFESHFAPIGKPFHLFSHIKNIMLAVASCSSLRETNKTTL